MRDATGLPQEIREILRDAKDGTTGVCIRERAAAAIVARDLCPRCAGVGQELLDTGPGGPAAWGTCHGCRAASPATERTATPCSANPEWVCRPEACETGADECPTHPDAAPSPSRETRDAGAGSSPERPPPTHRCKVCGALWIENPPSPVQPGGSWSLWSRSAGPCCDNVAMGEQIERITDFRPLCDPGPWGEPAGAVPDEDGGARDENNGSKEGA